MDKSEDKKDLVGRSDAGPADKKLGWIIYEPTYVTTSSDPLLPLHVDYQKNILRDDFK